MNGGLQRIQNIKRDYQSESLQWQTKWRYVILVILFVLLIVLAIIAGSLGASFGAPRVTAAFVTLLWIFTIITMVVGAGEVTLSPFQVLIDMPVVLPAGTLSKKCSASISYMVPACCFTRFYRAACGIFFELHLLQSMDFHLKSSFVLTLWLRYHKLMCRCHGHHRPARAVLPDSLIYGSSALSAHQTCQ